MTTDPEPSDAAAGWGAANTNEHDDADDTRPFKQVLMGLVAYRAAYVILMYLCIALVPVPYQEHSFFENIHHATELPGEMERHLTTWDAQPYLWISETGYGGNPILAGFYPLWPFLIQFLSGVVGG